MEGYLHLKENYNTQTVKLTPDIYCDQNFIYPHWSTQLNIL